MSEPSGITASSSRRVTAFALSLGALVAWWGAFHEAICGFILAGVDIEPVFAYVGCYLHSLGCILGAVLAPLVSKRLEGPRRHARVHAILGIDLVVTLAIFLLLDARLPIAPTVLQVPVNALACISILLALETLSEFTFKEIGGALVCVLCCFALANYAVFPALVSLPHGVHLIMMSEILLLTIAGITAEWYYRLSGKQNETSGAYCQQSNDSIAADRKAFAWQPACFLAAYGTAFGFMHVESCKLVISFPERSLWLLVGIACATAIISLFILRLNKRKSIWRYYRSVVFPLIICAFLMLQIRTASISEASIALVYASMSSFFMLTALACIRISSETAIPVTRVGRTAICFGYGFGVIGMSVNHYLTFFTSASVLDSPLIEIAVFIMLCAATFWIGDDRSVCKIWGLRIEKDPRSMVDKEYEELITEISEQYNLTAKEQSVLALLARGKRASQISEEQFISVNTVRTHIRNVYNKLDVHSYQELLKKLDDEQHE